MTVAEDTAAKINAKNTQLTAIISEKDTDTLDLAKTVDQQLATTKALSGDNTRLTGDLQTMTQNRNTLQTEFNSYKTKYPPVIVTPPPAGFKTLFGLGGGNTARNDVDLDRRYYGPNDKTKSLSDTTSNETKGILSWNSFKCPHGWVDMAKGAGDAWFVDLMKAHSEAIKPVVDDPDDVDEEWISIHHEPEGDADEDDWRVMQDRLSRLVPGGPDGPIKFWLTTTGWGQEFNTQRVAQEVDWETNLYPHGAPIYGIAYDAPYQKYGNVWTNGVKTATLDKSWTDPFVYVDALAKRGVQFDVEVAIGEWGFSDEAFAFDKTWSDKVMQRCVANPFKQLRGAAYFDTHYNSTRSWTLGPVGSAKRLHLRNGMNALRAA